MIADFRPGDRPIQSMAEGLIRAASADPSRPPDEEEVRLLRAYLARGPALDRRMVRRRPSAAGHEPPHPRRPVRGAVPLQRLRRARGGGGLRGAAARKRAGAALRSAHLRHHHHALGILGRGGAHRRARGGDQSRPLSHAAHEPRGGAPGDHRPGGGLRRCHRAGAGQSAPERPHLLRALGGGGQRQPARAPGAPRRPAAADAARAEPPLFARRGPWRRAARSS